MERKRKKKMCLCGYNKFNVTEKTTHSQHECQRCKRVYILENSPFKKH